jgi:tetratricopeptide (TPR) repeat protein
MRVTKGVGFLLALCIAATCDADDHLDRGKGLFDEGKYSAALAELGQGTGTEAKVYAALTQAAINDCPTALPVLSEQAKQVDTALGRLAGIAAAKCYSVSDNTAHALALLEALRKEYPKDADVLYLRAETEMKAFNQTTFEMFQHTPSSYRVHQLSAEILQVQNRYSDAVAEYRKAIQLNTKAPDLHYRLGRALLLQGHSPEALQEAAKAFTEELTISPEDSASEFQLGQIAQVQGRAEEAQSHFKAALKLSPQFVSAMIALGRLYVQQKQYQPAIDLLKRATELQPENEAAHYALLTAYRDAGQRDKAMAEKATLDRLQKPPEGEFSEFLKKLGDKQPEQ